MSIEIDIELRDANDFSNHIRLHRLIVHNVWTSPDGKYGDYEIVLDGNPISTISRHDRALHVMALVKRAVCNVSGYLDG